MMTTTIQTRTRIIAIHAGETTGKILSLASIVVDKEILKEIFGGLALFAGLYVMTVLAFCL